MYSVYSTHGRQSGLDSASSPTRQVARPFPEWRAALSSPAGGARGLVTSAKRRRWGSEMGDLGGGGEWAPSSTRDSAGRLHPVVPPLGRGPWVQPALLRGSAWRSAVLAVARPAG